MNWYYIKLYSVTSWLPVSRESRERPISGLLGGYNVMQYPYGNCHRGDNFPDDFMRHYRGRAIRLCNFS